MKPVLKYVAFVLLTGVIFYISCKKETSCEGCPTKNNKPPIANAGSDTIIILPADSIILNGNNSYDPDGNITQFLWTKIAGPLSCNISTPNAASTPVLALIQGVYQFELKVLDTGGLFSTDTIIITVNAAASANHPPVANAGQDIVITLPINIVLLNGIGSTDTDNNITNYLWTKIAGPSSFTISSANAVQTQVVSLVQGVYEFELKVTDAGGLVSKDTIRITVFAVTATEIIFTNQVLINLCYQPDMPGACWINGDSPSYGIIISDTANALPNSSILGVWVKMDTSIVWEQVPVNCWQFPAPYPQSNFTYCLTPDTLSVWSWFLSMQNLAGRKADVKILF